MNFDFVKYKESQNLIPLKIENKEKYLFDLMNIEHSWTGRLDAQIANTFFLESVQLIINAITLFEQGYFDCAFYSLRQSLEVSTTIIYLIDTDEESKNKELHKWKNQSRFPMYNQMLNLLNEREAVFADIKNKMSSYFAELDYTKKKLNKYVHKQGFNTFYISRNHPLNKLKNNEAFIIEFESYLKKCIGAIAVFRLAIDPFPILLSDSEIYHRTGDSMTEAFSDEFINEYIGESNIDSYKQTEIYQGHYNYIISEELKAPCVSDVVKHQYIDKNKIENILAQRHLLNQNDLVAVVLAGYSEKIAKIYCIGGLLMYFTSTKTIRKAMSWSGLDFKKFQDSTEKYNMKFDEAYISCVKLYEENYFIEHNEILDENEISMLEEISTTHNML